MMLFQRKTLIAICTISALTGCATSSVSYTPPQDYPVKNQVVINKSFDSLWKSFLQSVAGTFFVINNIEKESGIINVSFSSSQPTKFVDCGEVTRTYWGSEGSSKYVFNYADSQSYLFTEGGGFKFVANRQGKLDGRANILLTPLSSTSTKMTVNAIYSVNVQEAYRRNALVDNNFAGSFSDTITFTSLNPESSTRGGIVCKSKGVLEKQIIDSVK